MPRIIISDSSVLMDLATGRLFEALSALPYEFVIPDVMFAEELLDLDHYRPDELTSFRFAVGELSSAAAALTLHAEYRRELSLNDCFALAMAEERGCLLLTGDRALRRIGSERRLVSEVRGTLWLTQELRKAATTDLDGLHAGLVRIRQHPRTRLPLAELDRQIANLRTSNR